MQTHCEALVVPVCAHVAMEVINTPAPVSPKTNSWSMMVHYKSIYIVIIILTHTHTHTHTHTVHRLSASTLGEVTNININYKPSPSALLLLKLQTFSQIQHERHLGISVLNIFITLYLGTQFESFPARHKNLCTWTFLKDLHLWVQRVPPQTNLLSLPFLCTWALSHDSANLWHSVRRNLELSVVAFIYNYIFFLYCGLDCT